MRRPTSPPELRAVLTRRATLGLAASGVAALGVSLSGCTPGDLDRDLGGSPAPADDSPDVALVAGLVTAIDARLAAVETARAASPSLRGALRPLLEMHRAHREVLDPSGDPSASPSPTSPTAPTAPTAGSSTGRPARVLRRLRADETTHQAALVEAAVSAESGALARLVGTMSAGAAQHLAVLPAQVAR